MHTWKPQRGTFCVIRLRWSGAFYKSASHFVASLLLCEDSSLASGEGQVLHNRNKTARGLSFWHCCRWLFFGFRATRPKMAKKKPR